MARYQKPSGEKPQKGHNHPARDKCGEHCPRNAKYKGPVKKFGLFNRKKD